MNVKPFVMLICYSCIPLLSQAQGQQEAVKTYGSEHAFAMATQLMQGQDPDPEINAVFSQKRNQYIQLLRDKYDASRSANSTDVLEALGFSPSSFTVRLHGFNEDTAKLLSPDFAHVGLEIQQRQIPLAASLLKNNILNGHLASMVYLAQFLGRNEKPCYEFQGGDIVSPQLAWNNYDLLFTSERFREEGVWFGEKNIDEANILLKTAETGGMHTALYYEAILNESNPTHAVELLEQCFQAGDIISGFTLAHLYSTGQLWGSSQTSLIDPSRAFTIIAMCQQRIKKISTFPNKGNGTYIPWCDPSVLQQFRDQADNFKNEAISKTTVDEALAAHQWDKQYSTVDTNLIAFTAPKPISGDSRNNLSCHDMAETISKLFPTGLIAAGTDIKLAPYCYRINEQMSSFDFVFPCSDGDVFYRIDDQNFYMRNLPLLAFERFQFR